MMEYTERGRKLMLPIRKMFTDLSGRPGGPVVKPLPYPTTYAYAEGDDE